MIPSSILKTNWKLYAAALFFSLFVHLLLYVRMGSNPSTDYHNVYAPEAREIAGWIKGSNAFPHVSSFQIFHLGYVFLVAVIFLIFGMGNLKALVFFQIIISVPIYLLVLHIALKRYYSKFAALLFTLVSISFFDNIMWTTWAVPDSFYKVLFILSYFILPALYLKKKYLAFAVAFVFFFVILVFIRMETLFLFLPLAWFCRGYFVSYFKEGFKPVFLLIAFLVFCVLFSARVNDMSGWLKDFYVSGTVVSGTGTKVHGITNIEPYDDALSGDIVYNVRRFARLVGLRIFYFFNVFPPFWSTAHRIYYAVYMLCIYILIIPAIMRAVRTKDGYFFMFFLVYLQLMALQALTFVDSEKRYIQSSLPFLIMFAGYGFDDLCRTYRERFRILKGGNA